MSEELKLRKLFVSQPMRGKTDTEIRAERAIAVRYAQEEMEEPFEVIPSYTVGRNFEGKGLAVQYLAESLRLLADADVAVFAKGWEEARGCRIEMMVCRYYGIDTIEMKD